MRNHIMIDDNELTSVKDKSDFLIIQSATIRYSFILEQVKM